LWEEAAAAMDHRTARYQPILELADLLLNGAGASVGDPGRVALFSSFLVDMNLVFERLVRRLLADFGPEGARVENQVSRTGTYRWSENPHGWRRPRLRPDFVVYDRLTNRPRMILDTKYKPLGATRRPSAEDLYQLTLYSMSFEHPVHIPSRIVYPAISGHLKALQPRVEFYGASSKKKMATVEFYGLPLLEAAQALIRNNATYLRRTVNALLQPAKACDRPIEI
jgi:5-methylcytosine-specific restriction endonuclease McrBC regulatory subunit McrC